MTENTLPAVYPAWFEQVHASAELAEARSTPPRVIQGGDQRG